MKEFRILFFLKKDSVFMHLDGRQGSDQGSLVCPKCFNSLSCLDLVWIYSVFICFVEIHTPLSCIESNQTSCKVHLVIAYGIYVPYGWKESAEKEKN